MKIRSEKHGVEADVYFYQDGDVLPETGTYFVVTAEGYFIHVDGGGMVSGLVPCNKEDLSPFLGKLEQKASYNFPPVPFEAFVQALTFLRAAYRKHRSEACVVLLYKIPTLNFALKRAVEDMKKLIAEFPDDRNQWDEQQRLAAIEQHALIQKLKAEYQADKEEDGTGMKNVDHSQCEFVVACPKQNVSSASVHYGEEHTGEKISDIVAEVRAADPTVEECGDDYSHQYMHVCSIHSHPDFNAYHSGVDDSDEFIWDGLHLTIGGVMKDDFEISASLTLQGSRFMLDPLDCVSGVAKSVDVPRPGFFSWAVKKKDLYHLAHDPEDILNVKGIRSNAASWVENKVKGGGFFYNGATSGRYGQSSWGHQHQRSQSHINHVRRQNPNHVRNDSYYGESPSNEDDKESG